MYNSGYSQAKMGLAAKSLHRSKERSCGYYVRIVLFFSSLIQSLIIVSLVLFLIYGEPQQTVEEKRIQELEQSYSRLSLENVALKAKEKNLTQVLNVTLTAKKLSDKDLANLRKLANISTLAITNLRTKWGAQKYRIRYQLEGTELRQDKAFLEECINMYEKKCKEDFVQSLEGIPKVGSQVTTTIGENAKCITENKRLNEDATWCKTNRTNIIEENKKVLKQVQQTYDKDLERLLLDVTKLNGNKKLLENMLSVKEIKIKMLTDSVNDLNSSLAICK
ncbi:hypothetical protein NFI96_032226, partial [Prochilodus magdalenae]